MDQFVSAFTNKIDTKGRVSVPASFRSVLAKDGLDGIYCYPSLDAPALDAGGKRLVDKINGLVEDLAPYWDERNPFHRSGRTHHSAGAAQGARRHHYAHHFCRPRREVPDVGTRPI